MTIEISNIYAHHQARHDISNGSRFGRFIFMAREAVYIHIILEELGHTQPPTPLQTDNSMAHGHQLKNQTKVNQGHGHVIPMAEKHRILGTVSNLLDTWKIELCGLLDKAPSSHTPEKHTQRIYNPVHSIINAPPEKNSGGGSITSHNN